MFEKEGTMFDNFNDNDNVDSYPHDGDIEQKAIYSIEKLRQRFYGERKTFIASRPSGDLYHALLMAYGPTTAESYSKLVSDHFQNFIKQAYLTEEGESTHPSIPVDKMVNHELRRIRSAIILHVSHFFHQFESMMPENLIDWSKGVVLFNIGYYVPRYSRDLYDDINVVIPNKKMKPPSTADVGVLLNGLSSYLSDPVLRYTKYVSEDRMYIINSVRDELIRFILKDLPFNNDRLNEKPPLLADEIMGNIPGVPTVVH